MKEDGRGRSRLSGGRCVKSIGGKKREESVRRREVRIRGWRREEKRCRIVEEDRRDW